MFVKFTSVANCQVVVKCGSLSAKELYTLDVKVIVALDITSPLSGDITDGFSINETGVVNLTESLQDERCLSLPCFTLT